MGLKNWWRTMQRGQAARLTGRKLGGRWTQGRPLLERLEDRLAPTVAYQVPGSTLGNQAFGGSLGMDFNVSQPVVVTQLGVFDSGSNGLQSPLAARLYNRDTQAQVTSLSFAPGSTGT